MTYHTYAPEALLEKADFTLNLSLEGVYDVKNADGTSPCASIKVTGTTIQFSLFLLGELAEDNGETLLEAMAAQAATELGFPSSLEELSKKQTKHVLAAMAKEHTPFRSVTVTSKGVIGEAAQEATVTVTAPSYVIGALYFIELTTKEKLNSLATSFMPIDHDYDDDDAYYN